MITIKKIKAEDTYFIRKEVLRKNIPLPFEFKGDFDETTVHFGAFKDEKLVGVVSYMQSNHPNYPGEHFQLRGMATLEELQGTGIGKRIVTESIFLLKKRGINFIWCNARIKAVPFYQKLGFRIIGSEFEIPLIGKHFVMIKEID